MNILTARTARLLINQIEATERTIEKLEQCTVLEFSLNESLSVQSSENDNVFDELKEGAIAIYTSELHELNDRLNKMS